MFGRVPRLPVNVLFHTVLHDSAVTSYEKYVTCLANDLKEAMVIAQDHAVKEQKRHAQLYNRKVKGTNIDIGDRVLLANRKERGKKKLADRWESTVYTVVDMNPETHTYRIRDTITGREKVIHRNLLMLVNFLPVEDTCEMSDPASSMPATESSAPGTDGVPEDGRTLFERESESHSGANESLYSGSDRNSPVTVEVGQGPLIDPEPVDSERRTIEWITQLSSPSLPEADVTDITSVTSDPKTCSVSPEDRLTDQFVTCDSAPVTAVDIPESVRQAGPVLSTTAQTNNTSDTLHTVDQTSPTHCDTQTQVKIWSSSQTCEKAHTNHVQTRCCSRQVQC